MIIRVLCGIGDTDTARALATVLNQVPGAELAPVAADSAALLTTLDRLADESVDGLPEVVLVHERIGPMPAFELVREVAMRFPAVGVVLMSQSPNPDLYAAAMDVGARGVVGLPLSHDELAMRVQTAAAWATGVRRHLAPAPEAPSGRTGTLVTVAGAKGGVGSTVAAIELALAARAAGRATALVDMDLQSGDLASYLEVQFRRSLADLADINDISPRVLQEAMFDHPTGLALLLAPAEGERAEEVTDRAARQVLTALRSRFDVVVVDCGSQVNGANAVAVELADTAVLLTTPDVVAVRAAKRMVRLWDRLQVRKAEDTVVVLNRHTRGTEIQPVLVQRITGTRGARTVIPAAYRELQPFVDAGRLQDLDARSTVKQALWALAGELDLLQTAEPGDPGRRAGRQHARGRSGRKRGPGRFGDRGQASLEFLGMVPTILVVLALVWQCVLIGYTFTLAGNAADKAARSAATGHSCAGGGTEDLPGAWQDGADITCAESDGMVTASVNLRVPALFPGVASFPLTLSASAGAAKESDDG
ncbi:septum formation initiator [Wenjunlia vitaminophila]|uniref:Septum formation initiator n=1 Tax=Wenjunlia vitaminophila TaxID=76728 RepID=A0A0T6LLL9_WENVI|nr:AAA family ATPase [Wenjunlia vitaminophila]KRV47003.1 septum formation initiator [Wenjunlia vitaminophila]